MSYCRGSVYMYPHIYGHIECCACSITKQSLVFWKAEGALRHLFQHVLRGDPVPHYAITRLSKEVVKEIRR